MIKHNDGQSYLGPVMDGSAGCQAGPEPMRLIRLPKASRVRLQIRR